MPVLNWYPKRKQQEERTGHADVYQYELPRAFRVQVVHIWRDALGSKKGPSVSLERIGNRWKQFHDLVARELGVFHLTNDRDYEDMCCNWFLDQAGTDNALGLIELTFDYLSEVVRKWPREKLGLEGVRVSPEPAIDELNQRFGENRIGYQFENGQIIRVNSQFVHNEVVKPAFALLADETFAKAQEDFLAAHRHYREGNSKDCVVAAQRAFESTLKAICSKQQWTYKDGDRSSELLAVVRRNGLFPVYLDKGFDSYVAMMKTGLPGVRNDAGAHGEFPEAPPVPPYIPAYALHTTATNIVLLVEAMNALGKISS